MATVCWLAVATIHPWNSSRFNSKAKSVRPCATFFTVIVQSQVKSSEADIISAQHLAHRQRISLDSDYCNLYRRHPERSRISGGVRACPERGRRGISRASLRRHQKNEPVLARLFPRLRIGHTESLKPQARGSKSA